MPPRCSYGVGLLLLISCFRHVSAEEGALIRRVVVRVPSMPEHIVHRCACICISLSQSRTRTHLTAGGITPTESQTPKKYTSAPTSSRVLAANT
ncbi:hypothetical protein BDQ17DRAFT_1374436 [Cyathus striatus]|nr:hypothetical protein BDQ17DRAFT_1374436 [Cyathus striatus]